MRDSEGGRIAIATNLRGRHGMGGRRDGSEVAANVRLIAAAPDMLEALQLVRDYIVTMKGMGHEYQVAIDAAISKATT